MAPVNENQASFWAKLIRFLTEVIQVTETLSDDASGPQKKAHALDLVDRWYRSSGIRIRYLPVLLERWVVRQIASGLIDGLVEMLNKIPEAERP
jgi:hypothetical protein